MTKQQPDMRLVPVEPTEAMLDAGFSAYCADEGSYRSVYRAMLAAAPAPETDGEPICLDIPLSNHMKVTLEYDPDGSRTAILWNEANEPIADGAAPALTASPQLEQAGGSSDRAKILAYEDAHAVAIELGYPSLTEALEALEAREGDCRELEQTNEPLRATIEQVIEAAMDAGLQHQDFSLTDAVDTILAAITRPQSATVDEGGEDAEFEVIQDHMQAASSSGPRARAYADIQHYAAVYGQDGPVEVFEITRTPVPELSTASAQVQGGETGQ